MTISAHNRHGRFTVAEPQWGDPEFASAILALCVPYEIRRSWVRGGLEIFAYAKDDCFREVEEGHTIPEYGMNLVEVVESWPDTDPQTGEPCRNGRVTVHFEGFVEAMSGARRRVGSW